MLFLKLFSDAKEPLNKFAVPVEDETEAVSWMERQANSIAPKLLLPKGLFSQKINEFINKILYKNPFSYILYVIEPAIMELADFFQVSMISVKIRLTDIGIEEAAGARIYIDGEWVPPLLDKRNDSQMTNVFNWF